MVYNSKKNILTIGAALLTVFLIFYLIGNIKTPLIFELKKINPIVIDSTSIDKGNSTINEADLNDLKLSSSVIISEKGKSGDQYLPGDYINQKDSMTDSTGRVKILLIGDSQLEGLRNPVYQYCEANNYNLVSTIMWYGSSTKQWGMTDTLDYFIKRYRPSIIILAIGLNELFVNDLDNRKNYITTILHKFKKYHVKYFWIGPAAWTKDKGVINIMKEQIGELFYPSHLLKLDRCSDKRHPSRNAAKIWVDSIATYIANKSIVDFSKKNPVARKIVGSSLIVLLPEK